MVVKKRDFKVLLSAFDKLGTYFDVIGVIENANDYTAKELDAIIERKFDHWIQYIFVDAHEHSKGTIKCKYLFIYPEDENVEWVNWKRSSTEVIPYPSKWTSMQTIFEYDNYGNIIKTYDKN